jgi:uncharacterized membrane protein
MNQEKQADSAVTEAAEQKRMGSMEGLVGYLLLIGVIVSVGFIIVGTIWNWAATRSLTSDFTIAGENFFTFLTSGFAQLLAGHLTPHLMISLGIATLMFTPFLRVFVSMFYFAFIEHNWKYTIFTLFVFSVLSYSLFLR